MKSSMEELNVFTELKDPGTFWKRSLINYNCRELLVFNSYGRLISRIRGFDRNVLIMWRFLWVAKIYFENTKGVLSDDLIMFTMNSSRGTKQ